MDTHTKFWLLLTKAKEHFEAAQAVSTSGTSIVSDPRLAGTIVHGMVDSVLFLCARARRIARDDPESVKTFGVDAEQFEKFMDDVNRVRNVSEHWADVIDPRKTRPHLHVSSGGLKLGVDETSLIISGPTEIYVGSLNVHDVYLYITEVLAHMKPPPIPQRWQSPS